MRALMSIPHFSKNRLSPEMAERLWLVFGLCVLTALLAAVWHWTPVSDYAEPERVAAWMKSIRHDPWAYVIVVGVYVVSVLVLFPLTILTLATAMTFGALEGLVVSMVAALCAASFGYAIGHGIGKKPLFKYGGRVVRHVRDLIRRNGFMGVLVVHLMPVAPFAVVNLSMGALPAPYRTFLAGTFMALLPGAVIRSFLGGAIMHVWRNPDAKSITQIGMGLLAWLGVVIASHMLSRRIQHRRGLTS